MFIEGARGPTIDPAVLELLGRATPATLGHRTDFGFVRGLTPLLRPMKMLGQATTVRIPHVDSTAVHCALDVAKPGDVVVVDQSGDDERACWGGTVSYAAVKRGVAGAIVQGAITDIQEILDLNFPIFFRGITQLTTRILGIEGAINVPIAVGGVVIRPGDVIFADENGIAVLDPADAAKWAPQLAEKDDPAVSARLRSRIDAGERLADISGARRLFEAKRATPEEVEA
jgi:4-hydroxy-4-methyl-2-oxoglutarate aldolase